MEQTTQHQQLDREATARLAYEIWEQRGCPGANDVDCWLEAERRILAAGKRGRQESSAPAGSRPGVQAVASAEHEAGEWARQTSQTKHGRHSQRRQLGDERHQARAEFR